MSCSFILSRGKQQGQPCGRKITIPDSEVCKLHVDIQTGDNGCESLISRGDKKGQKCGKPVKQGNCCYAHCPEIEFKKCSFVIIRGIRKGQVCGRRCKKQSDFCTVHTTEPLETDNTTTVI